MCYSTKLEKLQLDAARIVTGLPIFTKTDKLYSETGWTTLSSRRHNRKLQLFYNIKNEHAPNYLRELIPPTVQSTTIYPLRNGSDLIISFCRLSITTECFIQSTVKLWNRLDQFDRNLDTLTKFKKAIRKEQSDNTKRIPKHFYYGPRKLNIRGHPFNLKGGGGVMVFLFRSRIRILIFLSGKARIFFPEFNIRLYDKNSESHYFFFLHQNQNIFFSNIWESEYFFRKKTYPPPPPPPPFKLNGRSLILTQLRNSYSFLNFDLSKLNIVNDAACSCGAPREDAFHYFFNCPNYTEIRRIMMNNLNWVQTSDLNLNLLTRAVGKQTHDLTVTASDSKTTQSGGDNRKKFPLGAALQVPQNFSFAPL